MLKRRLTEIVRAPKEILTNLFLYRHILMQMIKQEIKGRFAGSIGGFLWSFLHPILMLITYLIVFVYIFKLRISAGEGSASSALYLMAGIFPWIIIAEGLARGTSSMIENANLIQKTPFPVEILTAKAVLTPLFSHGISLILLALYKVMSSGSFGILIALPLVIILQSLFTLGIVFFTATLTVFFRDIMQLTQVLITFWIYLTPVMYTMAMIPDWARQVMYINPLYPLLTIYQGLFVRGSLPGWDIVGLALTWSVLFFVIGAFVFNKMKYEFADWL